MAQAKEAQKQIEKELTTLEKAVLIVTFVSFVGTVVNVCFAVIDHINLNKIKRYTLG